MSNEMSVDPILPVEMTVMDNNETVISQIEEDRIIEAVSPTMTVEAIEGGVLVTVTDKNGTTSSTILNGADGQDGQDGADGQDGQNGVGISYIALNADYTLTIHYTDGNSTTTASIRGEKGETGATGQTGPAGQDGSDGHDGADGVNAYVHIKYSASQPTQDSDMKDTADAWMGIYSGTSSTAPTAYTSYTWYKIKGEDGAGAVAGVKMNGSNVPLDQNNIADLGTVITSHQDITGKADKVTSATSGNFAGLDANGNLTDSGHKHGDYLTSHQDISGKQDKTDNALNTTAKTIVGAINEHESDISTLDSNLANKQSKIKLDNKTDSTDISGNLDLGITDAKIVITAVTNFRMCIPFLYNGEWYVHVLDASGTPAASITIQVFYYYIE